MGEVSRLKQITQLNNGSQLTIWRLVDGKAGHESQSLGLVKALSKQADCQTFDIKVSNGFEAIACWLSSTWVLGAGLPLPDLIIGAGHSTHLHLLAAKRAYGGKTIVLMQPTLPVRLFDLCLIPEHDRYQGSGEYLQTRGVLNPIQPEGEHAVNQALIMIGGPSKHCHWDTLKLIAQVYELLNHNTHIHYTLTTSRRTPKAFISAVKRIHFRNLTVVPHEETEKGWVAKQLSKSAFAWVTEDSVSMVYEALTAQVMVGLLNMPVKRKSRVSRGVQNLINQGMVARFDFLQTYQQKLKVVVGFMEAERCSQWILHSWMQSSRVNQPVFDAAFEI
ncbi:MAG: mitochondrial fission ELM1 family protein [Methylophilaceae bacterium]|nr:MAG: mitochondrial fission ELM1 family protein [Methylophilaceae bacterium]